MTATRWADLHGTSLTTGALVKLSGGYADDQLPTYMIHEEAEVVGFGRTRVLVRLTRKDYADRPPLRVLPGTCVLVGAEPPEPEATEEPAEPASLVPALSSLDLDQLRAAAPALRTELVEALRADATERRAARGAVVTPEDTYDLVRRLTAAQEVLTQFSQAFADAAKEAAALIAEEAVTAMGEQDGVPNGSLFVPDGAGQRIAVSNEWDSNTKADVWDVGTLVAWLAEDQTEDAGVNIEEDGGWTPQIVAGVARDAMHRLLALGRFAPQVKAIEALRLRAAERGDDVTAALLRQLRTRGPRLYKGVKITREPMPRSQR